MRLRAAARRAAGVAAWGATALGVAFSAVLAKEAGWAPALANVGWYVPVEAEVSVLGPEELVAEEAVVPATPIMAPAAAGAAPDVQDEAAVLPEFPPATTRWFNGRPIRPARVVTMIVTGYSPDARSCGASADGLTATLHSVETNAFRLAAADPRVLAYGSMISVPGYDSGQVVPVLDCGGAIKGARLDMLFQTHEQARKWGKKRVKVTIWEYADGKPAENPRKAR